MFSICARSGRCWRPPAGAPTASQAAGPQEQAPQGGIAPQAQQGFGAQACYGAPQAHPQFAADTRPMTIDDVVAKTGTTLGLLAIVGAAVYLADVRPALRQVRGIGGSSNW